MPETELLKDLLIPARFSERIHDPLRNVLGHLKLIRRVKI
jgi:hypothetical protein